jgi:DNA primase
MIIPIIQEIRDNKQDAIMWQVERWMNEAGTNPNARAIAIDRISVLLTCIKSKFVQEDYMDLICAEKAYKIKKRQLLDPIADYTAATQAAKERKENRDDEDWNWIPSWADKDEVLQLGFVERLDKQHTGYYFKSDGNSLVQRTNFIIKPLYHIYGNDNRRMICVNNGFIEVVIEIPSKNMLIPDQFMAALFHQGNFQQKAGFTKFHLVQINLKYGEQFPLVHPIDNLGWQNEEGFFAFANRTYRPPTNPNEVGVISVYDEYGVVQVDKNRYLSPSQSKANERVRGNDNIYENDMFLSYVESSINFEQWCALMEQVYDKAAWMGIAFSIATLFRDVIMHVTKIPHLYAYGAVGAGKSEFGESINNLFFSGKDNKGDLNKPMNLNQGTEFAFWNRMERFNNCPNALNEFDEWAIDDNWFRGIKSAYDGEGRSKGSKEKNRSISQKVNCTLILMGQYLGTRDDNSVLTRSLPIAFKVIPAAERPEAQIKAFTLLKELESKGLSSILTEMMDLRPLIKSMFANSFAIIQKRLVDELRSEGVNAPLRILKNISCMIAVTEIALFKFKLPYTIDEFFNYSKGYVRQMTNLVTSTSGVSEFWSTVEYLFDRGMIKEGMDFEVSTETSITITTEDKSTEKKTYLPGKTILFLRFEGIHKLYLEICAKTRKVGLNESTLKLYMKDQKWFCGWMKSKRFKGRGPTSCFAYDYDELNINLVRESAADAELIPIELIGEVNTPIEVVPGQEKYKAMVVQYSSLVDGTGATRTYTTMYNCFFTDPLALGTITKGYKIQLKGNMSIIQNGQKEYRTIDVTDFESVPNFQNFERKIITPKDPPKTME